MKKVYPVVPRVISRVYHHYNNWPENIKQKKERREEMINSLNQFVDKNRDEIISMLEIMVNIDSASEFKEGLDTLGGYLAEKFAFFGFEIEKDTQNFYGNHFICKLKGEGPNILIIGHFGTALPQGAPREGPLK